MKTKNDIRGVTLVELMIVVAIAAILIMLAVPAMNSYFRNERLKSLPESVASGIKDAQTYAMKTNTTARFRINANGWDVIDVETNNNVSAFDWSQMKWGDFETGGRGGKNTLVFNGIGLIVDHADQLTSVTTKGASPADINRGIYNWRVEISDARGMRICRPDLPPPGVFDKKTDPRICRD